MAYDDSVAADFVIEAREIADRLGEQLVALEQLPDDAELLNAVFRGFHTIKGGAGFLDLAPLVEACHVVEEAFGCVRGGKRQADADLFDGAQALLDHVQRMLAELAAGQTLSPAPAHLCERMRLWAGDEATPAAPAAPAAALAAFAQGDGPVSDDEFEALLDQLHGGLPGAQPPPPPAPAPQPPRAARPEASPPAARAEPAAEATLRIEARRLDAIVNLVGELVLSRNRLKTLRSRFRDEELERAVTAIDVATTRLQGAVMRTRMQPVGRVFQRFPKLARDVARMLDKEVELVLEGADTELDRTLVESLADPLVHLVRNAIDHGIEAPAVRERIGKPRAGRVLLAARQEGDHIAIEVRDDGAGMDPEVLRAKAVEKGVLDAEQAARLGPEECYALIFHPGFSTRSNVSEISGRGVGMDVVQSKIRDLNGRVQIQSRLGLGTAFVVRVPLTLAILPALLVQCAERAFALPLARVQEVVRYDRSRLRWFDGHPMVDLHGQTTPLLGLRRWLGEREDDGDGHLVLVQSGDGCLGLHVDHVRGREEVVVKPLPRPLHALPGYVGATLTGDGRMALILDVDALGRAA
ncbi:MAG: chemotaxis protein CheA [Pseudomonadota bacterium]